MVTVVAWHAETGVNGARELDGRPALMSALADLAAHRTGVLALEEESHASRSGRPLQVARIARIARSDKAPAKRSA